MTRIHLSILILLILVSCNRTSEMDSANGEGEGPSYTKYASGFEVDDYGTFRMLHVFDPWQSSKGVTFSYVLAKNRDFVPDSLGHLTFIQTPVSRVVTLSTTHVAMIDQLGKGASIKGVSGTGFIYNSSLRNRIEDGDVKEVGYDQGLNYEAIVGLQPDVLFMYGVDGSVMATSQKLAELRVPVVFCGDYLEPHPLGKAEWIRFLSLFYDLEEHADRFFSEIDSVYNSYKSLTNAIQNRPLVLTGLPWKDTWYMAGGESFAARLIRDAGGDYLWADNHSTQAVPLDLESVYARAIKAQIWINPGAATSLNELQNFDQRFTELEVIQNKMIFNNNKRLNLSGGNDYWESGTVRPDLVLADLIQVFHPDLLADHHLFYYRQLK